MRNDSLVGRVYPVTELSGLPPNPIEPGARPMYCRNPASIIRLFGVRWSGLLGMYQERQHEKHYINRNRQSFSPTLEAAERWNEIFPLLRGPFPGDTLHNYPTRAVLGCF